MRTLKTAWIVPIVEGVFVFGLGASSGCAGPATPLGAIWDLHPQWDGSQRGSTLASTGSAADDAANSNETDEADEGAPPAQAPSRGLASWIGLSNELDPKIHFDPPRQWLHGPHALTVIVNDPRGVRDDYGLEVRYHGHDVTRSFLMQARVSREEGGSRLRIEVPSIRLSPSAEHLIEVGYRNPDTGKRAFSQLRSPVCRAFDRRQIQNLDEFKPDPALTQAIDLISRQMGFNPAFAAALIAQESAFNPQSVSLARALGLTQVTGPAEEEVTGLFPRWPRYPGLNSLPAPLVKLLVMSGEVNARNEWRLNPDRSIRGGLAFAQRLADRWLDSESFSKVSWAGGPGGSASDAEVARTRLILASYNSGYARVIQAINRYGAAWLMAPELKEARRYVNRIFSYCDAFERVGSPTGERQGDGTLARPAVPKVNLPGAPAQWPQNSGALPPALVQRVMNENET